MTGNQVVQNAMELMMVPGESLIDYTPYAVTVINTCLPGLRIKNDMVAKAKEKTPVAIPLIATLNDDIPMEEECLYLLTLLVCVHFLNGDEDNREAFFNKFLQSQEELLSPTYFENVEDVYQ